MKSKSSRIFVLALVATLVLGIGFATISSVDLTISGDAAVANKNVEVSFNGTVIDGGSTTGVNITGSAATADSLTATIKVADLKKVGDKAVIKYTVQNKDVDLKASVSKKSITPSTNDYFTVTTSVDSAALSLNAATNASTPATGDITVTVELKKLPIAEADGKADITIVFTATPIAK